MKLLVTGGAGFIGSAVVRAALGSAEVEVVNVDKLTYAGNLDSLADVADLDRYAFVHGDINDRELMAQTFSEHQPDAVIHLAAETHVDRSIDAADDFVRTNVDGTCTLLDAARQYWLQMDEARAYAFRFVHVSTDEVFGDLGDGSGSFCETSPYAPSSPYSATKAAGDHLVRAWHRTYSFPSIVVNCSNAYGPYQFPEKFIPHVVLNALQGRSLPLYGDGLQARDWNHVDDLVDALLLVVRRAEIGQTYAIGTGQAVANRTILESLCDILDEHEGVPGHTHRGLIKHVEDRPGHDRRYCVDSSRLQTELGWKPRKTLQSGLTETVDWYLHHKPWWERILSGEYRLTRLGATDHD